MACMQDSARPSSVHVPLSGMTVKCGVAPWRTVKISPRKSQEIGARPKKFNKRQQGPWEFDFGMF